MVKMDRAKHRLADLGLTSGNNTMNTATNLANKEIMTFLHRDKRSKGLLQAIQFYEPCAKAVSAAITIE